MKAYIKVMEDGNGYKAEVVTEDDYHNRGPFARSYLSPYCVGEHAAYVYAEDWIIKNNYTLVRAEDI